MPATSTCKRRPTRERRYIDSSGVASLVECLQNAKKAGQKLALVSVSEGALRVLQLARLDRVFMICDKVEDGLTALT